MPLEFAQMILRKSVGSMAQDRITCSACRRTPVAGELMHRLEGDRLLCDLCLVELPEEERAPLSSERVHASERHLAVVRRAA